MAKRKLRSSETESTETEQRQIEQEPLEDSRIDVQQQTNVEDEEQMDEGDEDEDAGDEEEEVEEEEEEEEYEEEGPVNESNDVVLADQVAPEGNGGVIIGAGEGEEGDGGEEEEEDLELEEEPVEKLIDPFSKEQLVGILKQAVSKYPEFIESVNKLADSDPVQRKIFVHGLGWDADVETLTGAFGKYGEIEDCKLVTDKVSGKSKGYAFILFKHRIGARKALKQPQKKVGNRIASCQLASAGPVPTVPPPSASFPVSEYTQRKIFVSNVAADLDPQKLVEFFSKFGEIEEGPLGLDKQTGKPKGFALFVYKSVESAKKALEEPHKNFEGHILNCQKAVDGPKPNKPFYQQNQYQPHHQEPKYPAMGASGSGHMMAPAAPGLTPAIGQALTALLATQGGGLGNLLGGLGGGQVNQGMPPVTSYGGYNQGAGGGYGNQMGMQGGYRAPQMGRGGGGRSWQGGGRGRGRGGRGRGRGR